MPRSRARRPTTSYHRDAGHPACGLECVGDVLYTPNISQETAMSGQRIAYVALAVRDADALASVLERQLGLRRADLDAGTGPVPVFSVGGVGVALCSPGHPYVDGQDRPGVHHIALAADDLSAAA